MRPFAAFRQVAVTRAPGQPLWDDATGRARRAPPGPPARGAPAKPIYSKEEPRTCRPPAACGRPFGLPGRGWFQRLQALEYAIAYRRARVTAQCAACGPPSGRKCEDHARDLELIAEYQPTARAVMQDTPGPPGASRPGGVPRALG
jgi:hypothetical protein